MRVDLPAPLAPISPVTPGAKVTVRPPSAVTPPGYTLVSAVASMTGRAGAPGSASAARGGRCPIRLRGSCGLGSQTAAGRARPPAW